MEQEKIAIDKSAIKLSKEEIIKRLEYNDELLSFIVDIIDKFNGIYEQSCRLTKSFNNRLAEERKEKDTDDITQDTNNTTLDELIITDELATAFPRIHNLRKNTTVLNDLITNKVSSIFWKDAFENEITNLFDASEKNNIITNIVGIINKNNIDTELLYKNFYDIIVVLKTQYHDNRNLYKAFMNHLQDRYVDHWDFTNKYKKEDADMHYYTLFCKCKDKIAKFIDEHYTTETDLIKSHYVEVLNKYLSFLYILHTEVDKTDWKYDSEDIVKDQQQIIELNEWKNRVCNIKFYDTDQCILASFKSEKIIDLISDSITGYISRKIIFNPENINKKLEVEYKIEIFALLKSDKRFINTIIKATVLAINEIGLTFKSDGKKNEFIYDIIDSIIPKLLIPDYIPNYSEKNSKVKSIIRTVEQHLYEDFFCLTYKGSEKGIFNDNYQPKLIYTDKIGKEKVIPTFSDLF